MSRLRVFTAAEPTRPELATRDHAEIARHLGGIGVRFEQWQAAEPIAPGDPPDKVLAAYASQIDRLKRENGYQAVDVISLNPEHPDRDALRQKFLNEHTHSEDEVRFFVAGSGLFTLHVDGKVFEVLCEAGDLIGVPDNTPHWFDMGPRPYFVAIRLFTNVEGWVARFTGTDIAQRFPRHEPDQAA
jgi:1,2-dihydroxy-3-keto-5-methylthiopentene dioxygenase